MMSSMDSEISQIIIDLCATGTRTEGVFRKSGNMNTVNYKPYETFGIHDKATRLKQCINRVKGKLVGRQLTEKLMTLVEMEDNAFPAVLKTLNSELPGIHLQLISYVVKLLRLIAENEDVTLMNPRNLSLCLTPAIFDVSGINLILFSSKFLFFANKMREEKTYDLLEQMIRHPKELLPYFELYVRNLMSNVEAKACLPVVKEEKEEKLENEEKRERMVAQDVLQNYGNCIKELSQGMNEKREMELTVCWELSSEENISSSGLTLLSQASSTQSEAFTKSSSNASPLESPKPAVVFVPGSPKCIDVSAPAPPKSPEDDSFSLNNGMTNIDKIMKGVETLSNGRMSTEAFSLEFDGNGNPMLSRKETNVWFNVGTTGRLKFFETFAKLTNK